MSDSLTDPKTTPSERRIFALGKIAQQYENDNADDAFDRALDAAYTAGRLSVTGLEYPDNTYTPYGRRSIHNLSELLGIASLSPTVVSVINRAYDEIVFLRALAQESKP